jgi:penicillin-binding protein-related factor A (putative recombinase)
VRGGPLFEKSIKKSNDRITVKPASAVNSAQLEYQTCVQTTADKPINQTYLISLEQFRNFSHIIQDKQASNKNINLDDIEKWGGRIA